MAKPITIQFIGDTSKLRKALGDTESDLARLGGRMQAFGAKASLFLSAPLVLAGSKGKEAASGLEQSVGAVETVFGSAAAKIDTFGATAAKTAGLSKRQVNEMAAVVGAGLKGVGFGADEAAETVIDLEKRAADLAATFGGTTQEAIEAIGSALRGERDPIERFGVSIKQADVDARIAAEGLDTSTAAARKHSEAQATLALIMESSSGVRGKFIAELDTAAGSEAVAAAEAENMSANLGESLLPITTKVNEVIAKLAGWFGSLSPEMQTAIVVIGGVAAAMGPVLTVGGTAIKVIEGIGGAFKVMSAIVAANPWLALIAATVAVVTLIVQNWDSIVAFVKGLGAKISAATSGMWDGIKNAFKAAINWIIRGWNSLRFEVPGFKVGPIGYDGFALGVPPIPLLAHGGVIAGAGSAIVGERGPELLSLPRGAVVEPLNGRTTAPQAMMHIGTYVAGKATASEVVADLWWMWRTGGMGA